jgi:hypothetical protein
MGTLAIVGSAPFLRIEVVNAVKSFGEDWEETLKMLSVAKADMSKTMLEQSGAEAADVVHIRSPVMMTFKG